MKINQNLPKVELYSDGWARPNPWPWAYWVILKLLKKNTNSSWLLKEFSGFEKNTTNNRMELTWVIIWLSKLKEKCDVQVFTDSSYVVNGIEKGWVKKWKENNWMRTKSEKATNYDLWEKLLNLLEKHDVKFNWIKGHNWHKENERCDEIATNQILKNSHLFSNVEGEPKSSPQPSTEGEGVGKKKVEKEIDISWKQKKIKVKKPWDKCRKCSDIVIKSIPKKKNTTNKNYYYNYYLTCQNCKTNYFVDEAKVFINKLDI